MYQFLESSKSEYVVMRVKHEGKGASNKLERERFRQLFMQTALLPDMLDKWYLEQSIPNVEQLRGKIWLINEFSEELDPVVGGLPWKTCVT